MTFRTALSGLNAASQDLRVTGNNIANSSTTGFKESRAEFADVFAVAYGGISKTAVGSGVKLSSVTQQFTQGVVDSTGNSLDLALSGQGFFTMSDGGARSYTRDGSFQVDRDGYVVNSTGQRLQAYPVSDPVAGKFDTGNLSDLRLAATAAPPSATDQVGADINLSSQADDLSAVTFDPNDPSSYSYSTSLSVYDSLGQQHTATLYFRNVGSLQWESNLTMDGNQVGTPQNLTFAGDGSLSSPTGAVSFGAFNPTNGADPMNIAFDFSNATQYGNSNSVTALRQNGFASGRLTGMDIDENGIAFARFTNGQSLALGQVAVANFANPQGLQPTGDNAWAQTYAAGDPIMGTAGSGDMGLIQSGGLEGSNVDISTQLVNLITAQRNFQANAQVISTADTITQTIINMR